MTAVAKYTDCIHDPVGVYRADLEMTYFLYSLVVSCSCHEELIVLLMGSVNSMLLC